MRKTALATLALATMARAAAAQQPVGPDFQVNANWYGIQWYPDVAMDGAGNLMFAWDGDEDHGGSVAARRFDACGVPVGAELTVNTFTTSHQGNTAISAAPDGRFVVVFKDQHGNDGSDQGVFARRYAADGTPLDAAEFLVNAYTTYAQGLPAVASDAGGNFVVVWQSYWQDGSRMGIFGRRFAADGSPRGGEFQVNTYTTGYQRRPFISGAPDGRFVVGWQDDTRNGHLFARLYDTSGNPRGPEFRIHSTTAPALDGGALAMADDGGFVAVWDQGFGAISARRFDADGTALGSDFAVSAAAPNASYRYGSLAHTGNGRFLVVWTNQGSAFEERHILARHLAADGTFDGLPFQVNSSTSRNTWYPAVAADRNGNFVVTWWSHASDGDASGVHARRFGDLIFQDGFETGDASRWSDASVDAGDLSVTAGAALRSSSAGLRGLVDDTAGLYVEDDSPTDERCYRARFYLDPSSFDPGEASAHFRTRVFIAFEDNPSRRLLAIVLKRSGGQYSLMARARLDDNSQADSGFVPITAGPHHLEVQWLRASGPEGRDGVLQFWVDGALAFNRTDLDNSLSAVDFVRLGALSVKSGASGTLRWDEFVSHRASAIGP